MNYKPRHKSFETPEIDLSDEPDRHTFFNSFGNWAQIKLSNADSDGKFAATDAFIVLLQDLVSKGYVDESCFAEIVRLNITKSLRALKKKNYEAA